MAVNRLHRCQANLAQIRQSQPDFGLVFQIKCFIFYYLFLLGFEAAEEPHRTPAGVVVPVLAFPIPLRSLGCNTSNVIDHRC